MKEKNKNQEGITLIALVITIIVMLILVAVTINMAINGGLFSYAGRATSETQEAKEEEEKLASGQVTVDGVLYNSIDDYLDNNPLVLSYEETAKDENGILKANATYESDGYTAVIPKGFKISEETGESSIATGLVIQDAEGNEFVWIPVTEDLESFYSYLSDCSEPTVLEGIYTDSNAAYDSQDTLDYLYGENYFNYAEDFKYADEYADMVAQVNKYNGFYIGRYEITIDSNGNIGSRKNTTVLTAYRTISGGTNSNKTYYYRWHGIYYASKNADVTGNGIDVQTAMIYGVLWDKTMEFIRTQNAAGKTTYDVDVTKPEWHTGSRSIPTISGQANPGVDGDVALNIWDLESNACEWTQEAIGSIGRITRGGENDVNNCASHRHRFTDL